MRLNPSAAGRGCTDRWLAGRLCLGCIVMVCSLRWGGAAWSQDHVAGPPARGLAVASEPQPQESAWPSPSAMRTLTIELLKREADARGAQAKADALVELCDLYVTLRQHPKYAESEIVKGEAVRVRRRLITAGRQLSERLQREQVARPDELSSQVDAAIAEALRGEDASLRERSSAPDSKLRGGRAPGAADGPAWQLVELIQRTVHPDFWEPSGGPGSIRYFAMKRVLVVRATTEVHEELAALLRQL